MIVVVLELETGNWEACLTRTLKSGQSTEEATKRLMNSFLSMPTASAGDYDGEATHVNLKMNAGETFHETRTLEKRTNVL